MITGLCMATVVKSQPCTAVGQTPNKAIPVCGFGSFTQTDVPICLNGPVATQCGPGYNDRNPTWYKFTCYSDGVLVFRITPADLSEDFDWQLFDVTNAASVYDVYSDAGTFVACSWSGLPGITGTGYVFHGFVPYYVACAGTDSLIVSAPPLQANHKYLLLVSHYTPTTSGYTLDILSSSTATLMSNAALPELKSARALCDGSKVIVKLTSRVNCNSITATGSEFSISPPVASVISALGLDCSSSYDTDSLIIGFSNPLPAGNYTITVKKGTDGNTMENICKIAVPENEQVDVTVGALPPFGIDSITKPSCAPNELNLVLNGYMDPASVAYDGSDFLISGPSAVNISSASPVFTGFQYSKTVNIKLSQPIRTDGTYTITIRRGNDFNTLTDECGQQIAAGNSRVFVAKDSVHAAFNYTVRYGCNVDTINYRILNNSGITDYKWRFINVGISSQSSPQVVYHNLGQQLTRLSVSNGFCTDTAAVSIMLNNEVRAKFEVTDILCPNDKAIFKESSIGDITNWYWDFGNNNTSTVREPSPQYYPAPAITRDVPVKLVVQAASGCKDSLVLPVKTVNNCYIAVPGAFTPNKDGLNDHLYPLNAYKATDLFFRVYNRYGQIVFQTRNWMNQWNGEIKGLPADPGTYIWMLDYTDRDTGKRVSQKGTSILIR